MVSWGEIFVTVTAASYLLGRKELPKIGKFLGVFSGRSVGAVVRAKKEFFDATSDNDLVKLQRDFQRGIEELNEIRSELTSVGSMARPMQPTGTREQSQASAGSNVNHAAMAAQLNGAASSTAAFASSSPTPASSSTTPSGGRSSVSLASVGDYGGDEGVRRSPEASLAMAEVKLAQQGKFAPRIESLEGGADYVSASIMDSLLLERQKEAKRTQTPAAGRRAGETGAPSEQS